MRTRRAKGAFATACLSLLGLAAITGGEAPAGAASAYPGQGFLPDNRAWEMVSPPDKNGGYVVPDSMRTRAASDGEAVGFISLAAFGDAIGSGIATDYVARRSTNPDPGNSGWSTHAVTPYQEPNTINGVLSNLDPFYIGEFSADLQRGIFTAKSALTDDANVEEVLNLYRRDDLRSPGAGDYELITACPRCELTGPLPPLPDSTAVFDLLPILAGASPDLEHVAFESKQRLTTDTPAVAPGTPLSEIPLRIFEWEAGEVRLAGKVPAGSASECDADAAGSLPACDEALVSVGGHGNTNQTLTPHVVSDGSDGHRRVFFTVPTDAGGSPQGDKNVGPGNLYVRTDGAQTAKLNASERAVADAFAPAKYQDATPDGSRVLISTAQALTNDAPANSEQKLYLYDTTRPASDPENLTFLSPDGVPGEDGDLTGVIGLSEDASYVYFVAKGQLVAGAPGLAPGEGIYLWHDGELRFVAPVLPVGTGRSLDLLSGGMGLVLSPRQARLTPDGTRLLFGVFGGEGVLSRYGGVDYDHAGGRELYLYDAVADDLRCASCKPGGPSSATAPMSEITVRELQGGAKPGKHQSNALTPDGRYAFFSTGQKLVPEDTNGTTDAYVFDSATGEQRLLSSGEDAAPSWFLDASPDGSDAFFVTRESLSGWDVGNDYDLYDARVGGGFPEPPAPPPGCLGDACQPAPRTLDDPTPASSALSGPGNPRVGKPRGRCPKGKRRVKTRSGKSRCVKRSSKRAAKHNRRAGR